MPTPRRKKRVTVKVCLPSPPPSDSAAERVVIVVGPEPTCAETVAQGFATQGETMRVMWFDQARQALAAGVQKLAGVIVCHRAGQAPDGELGLLRSAWPETPVLAWQLG
jgi:hypothetical protein